MTLPIPSSGIAMIDPVPRVSRYQSLRTSRLVFARMAPLVRLGLWGIGVSVFLDQVRPLLSDAQFTWGERRIMGVVALVTLGGFGLGGWVASRLLKALAELIDLLIDGADAAWRTADLIELKMIPTLGRIANALEQSQGPSPDPQAVAVRRAIADRRWEEAERLIGVMATRVPGSIDRSNLTEELDQARNQAVEVHRQQLEAARAASDAEGAIDARDALTLHLRGERLVELDRQLVRWLLNLLQGWVRLGHDPVEVAHLAARIAETFGDTSEGANLCARLPDLRRRAGLCPRCGRQYNGSDAACPDCIAQGPIGRASISAGARISKPKDSPT